MISPLPETFGHGSFATVDASRFDDLAGERERERAERLSNFSEIGERRRPHHTRPANGTLFARLFRSSLKKYGFFVPSQEPSLVRARSSRLFFIRLPSLYSVRSYIHPPDKFSIGRVFSMGRARAHAMKISFVCRQFSLNPQTPLDRLRDRAPPASPFEERSNIFIVHYRASRCSVWRDGDNLKISAREVTRLSNEDTDCRPSSHLVSDLYSA